MTDNYYPPHLDLGPDVILWLEDWDGGTTTYNVPEAIAQAFVRYSRERGGAVAKAKIIRQHHPGGWDLSG